jgi:hypothetical protein
MKCGKTCEVFSRVVGYHRPVKNWNKGKQEEFRERKEFSADLASRRIAADPPPPAQDPRP